MTATNAEPVTVQIGPDGVATVTLNRPHAANARNQAMREALRTTYTQLASDDAVGCVVLTGAGDRHFCAGMDLKEAQEPETLMDRRHRLTRGRDIEELARLPLPTIAAINGTALGGGLEMALACDLRFMAIEAEVGLPELQHGLVPAGGATRRLPALVGPAKAYELIYLGTRVAGEEAEPIGLVNKAAPREELPDLVFTTAARIAGLDRHALISVKRLISAAERDQRMADMELDALLMLGAQRSSDT